MSYDGVVTAAAVSELQRNLTLGKIEKIYQPQSEQLIFNIHTKAGKKKLLLSVSGNHAGAYLTETVPENPASPPVFCMYHSRRFGLQPAQKRAAASDTMQQPLFGKENL